MVTGPVRRAPAALPLGELGLLPVNAYLIAARQPILLDTGLAIDRENFENALWSLVDDSPSTVAMYDQRDGEGERDGSTAMPESPTAKP
jgi:hypothetical protein